MKYICIAGGITSFLFIKLPDNTLFWVLKQGCLKIKSFVISRCYVCRTSGTINLMQYVLNILEVHLLVTSHSQIGQGLVTWKAVKKFWSHSNMIQVGGHGEANPNVSWLGKQCFSLFVCQRFNCIFNIMNFFRDVIRIARDVVYIRDRRDDASSISPFRSVFNCSLGLDDYKSDS